MTRDEVRLELLKIRHRHDRSPSDVITDCKVLENYILGSDNDTSKEKETASQKKRSSKNTDNPDILS